MKTRQIGSLAVSVTGLGCNNFGRRLDAAQTANVVDAALDAGVNFFDTADIYGEGKSEEYLGRALRGKRDRAIVASKFGHESGGPERGGHPDYVRAAVERSLTRLGMDHIDLYQLHTPDPRVPVADTLGALDELVKAGKVREIGCSNFSVEQLREAKRVVAPGHARFVSVQNEYSLLHREPEDGVLAECERQGIAFLPYFPLFNGLLTGKYRRGKPKPEGTRLDEPKRAEQVLTERNVEVTERLARFAESRGHSLLELAFSWLLAHRAVASVIAGATKVEQVRGNAAAARWELSAEEMEEVDRVMAGAEGAVR